MPETPLDGVRIVLTLAGGNALGAYQAGVCEALLEQGIEPEWVVGASIGAINGAIFTGNLPRARLAALKDLWRPSDADRGWPTWWDAMPDSWRRTSAATGTLLTGRAGMFAPIGTALGNEVPALYDNTPLEATLAGLLDFDRLNDGPIRYTATAVDLDTGEDAAFDTRAMQITAAHIRASSALPRRSAPCASGIAPMSTAACRRTYRSIPYWANPTIARPCASRSICFRLRGRIPERWGRR